MHDKVRGGDSKSTSSNQIRKEFVALWKRLCCSLLTIEKPCGKIYNSIENHGVMDFTTEFFNCLVIDHITFSEGNKLFLEWVRIKKITDKSYIKPWMIVLFKNLKKQIWVDSKKNFSEVSKFLWKQLCIATILD